MVVESAYVAPPDLENFHLNLASKESSLRVTGSVDLALDHIQHLVIERLQEIHSTEVGQPSRPANDMSSA
jgi:hypothetical protein